MTGVLMAKARGKGGIEGRHRKNVRLDGNDVIF
jgi:hypothetical protein